MKETFQELELDIIEFDNEDIIITSINSDCAQVDCADYVIVMPEIPNNNG